MRHNEPEATPAGAKWVMRQMTANSALILSISLPLFHTMFWMIVPGLLLLLWIVATVNGSRQMKRLRRLAEIQFDRAELPRLSVVIAARNEERRLGECLETVLASDYADLEIIVVNDRSTDSTAQIADSFAVRYPERLKVLHNTDLPDGWLGKCHALATGASQADGELLLFTDADVLFDRTALARAATHMQREEADQLVVLPDMVTYSFWERVLTTAFAVLMVLRFRPWRAMKRRSPEFIGVGAFNMVRRTMYDRIAGHRFLRLHVVDDMALGKLVKYSGGKIAVLFADGLVRLRWQESFGETIVGLEKNGFAAMNYSVLRALVGTSALVLVFWWGLFGLVFGPPAARVLSGLLAVAQPLLIYAAFRGVQRIQWKYAVVMPVGALFMAWAIIRSMIITLRQGGVRWRDSFYPLAEIRKYRL